MAKYVSYHAQIYNNRTHSNLGLHRLTTLMSEGAGDYRTWDAIDGSDDCPNYQRACSKFGVGKFLLVAGKGSHNPPVPFESPKSVVDLVETSSSIMLQIPEDATANEVLWTLTFPELDNDHEVRISWSGVSVSFLFYNGNTYIGGYSGISNIDWGSQWGYYRASYAVCGFPCISADKTYAGMPLYNAFVAYSSSGGFYVNPVIMRCSISASGGLDVNIWKSFFGNNDIISEADADNPYDSLVDNGNHGGEDTNFADHSDNVTEDALPTISAVGTGFATIFTPSKSQLYQLSQLFWDSNFFTFMQNLVENIEDMFTSLAMVPFTVTAGSTVQVTWLGFGTAIYLTLADAQYYEFDMGTIDLSGDDRIFKYDNCLDYSPFSKIGIYLPFIGFQDLDIDEIRNKTIHLIYRVDILSGACVALVKINGSTLYQFSGNCLTQIPITSENFASAVSDVVNVGIAAASARVAGAASAADSAAAESSEKMSQAQKEAHKAHAKVSQTNADNHLRSAAANAAMGLKPQYNKSGSVSSSVSMLAVKQPYLFLTTSNLAIPNKYQHYAGFPCNMTGKLNTFSGYTVVESIRLNDLVATTPEVEEIYMLLKEGVII